MCIRLIGSAICCCLQLGTKLLICIACSSVGILLIGGLIIYFVFFYNKGGDKKTTAEDATTVTDAARVMAKQIYNQHLKQHLFENVEKEKGLGDMEAE